MGPKKRQRGAVKQFVGTITIRTREGELDRWKEAAASVPDGVSLSQWVRRLLNAAAEKALRGA